jgi:hypothetical protein
MGKSDTTDLQKFLEPYPDHVKELALWLRDFIWDLYPNTNELIYDNYNAVAFGWSPTGRLGHTFCSVAVLPKYVHLGFYWGTQISDPEKMLLGKGNQYRYLVIREKTDLPKVYIRKLIKEAFLNSMEKVKDKKEIIQGKTLVKSISPTKKRPHVSHL